MYCKALTFFQKLCKGFRHMALFLKVTPVHHSEMPSMSLSLLYTILILIHAISPVAKWQRGETFHSIKLGVHLEDCCIFPILLF